MKHNFKIAISFLLVTTFVFSNIQSSKACGPSSLYAAFNYEKHPDLPFENFAKGEIGIIKPNFARSYLFVAYRYLNRIGLNQQEQTAVVKLWHERLGVGESSSKEAASIWLEARKKVSGLTEIKYISIDREVGKDTYNYYSNCLPDAFSKAAQILEERISKFGANSTETKDWVAAQDKVFSNCSEGQNIPVEAPANAHAVIKTDRAYQIASAYFYGANFDEAKTRFERISNDPSSPYNAVSALLVARTLIRKASLTNDEPTKKNSLSQAETQLKKVLANRNYLSFHESAQRLLSIVNYRLRPVERLHELAQTLSNRSSNQNLKQELWDYTMLLDNVAFDKNEAVEGQTQIPLDEANKDDLTDWLFTVGNGNKGFDHAVQRWESSKSTAWLVAALTLAKENNPKVSSLIQAADKTASTSPAFYQINYHIARLQLETGQKDEARRRIDANILNGKNNSLKNLPSTLNQFLSLRMSLATSIDEFLKYAQRKPAGFVWDYDGNEMPDIEDESIKSEQNQTLFDYDATTYFNQHFPLALLQAAAQNNQLPTHLRKRLAIVAFTRAVILEREEVGKSIAQTLAQLEPSLKPLLDRYLSATTNADRKAAGLYLILKTPGMTTFVDSGVGRTTPLNEIDSYRDNWWCGEVPKLYNYVDGEPVEINKSYTLDFLSELQKLSAQNDVSKLVSLGTAPNYLPQQTVAWGQRSLKDPRVPEALHLAVKSTRYGCTDENTGKYSKAAYDFLQKNFKNSTWAKQTPYWFKGN